MWGRANVALKGEGTKNEHLGCNLICANDASSDTFLFFLTVLSRGGNRSLSPGGKLKHFLGTLAPLRDLFHYKQVQYVRPHCLTL